MGRVRGAAVAAAVALVFGGYGCFDPDAPRVSERIALELVEVWRGGDPDLTAELFTATAVWMDPVAGIEARGLPEVVAYLTEGTEWASTLFVDLVALYAGPDHATIEWIREGTTQPVGGGAPRRFVLEGVTVIELEGGRIVRGVDYTDPTRLLVARGGRVVFPDGAELRPVTLGDDDGADTLAADSIRDR